MLTVVRNESEHRYEAHLDGAVVGFSRYRLRPGQVVFTHTEIDSAYEGQGFGGQLAKGALDDVRARGEQVIPICPFVKAYIDKHPEYADLIGEYTA